MLTAVIAAAVPLVQGGDGGGEKVDFNAELLGAGSAEQT
jgi:hypothetical protein